MKILIITVVVLVLLHRAGVIGITYTGPVGSAPPIKLGAAPPGYMSTVDITTGKTGMLKL